VRTGVRLAVDVGSVRVGVARSDGSGSLAVPVVTLKRDAGDLRALADLVTEYEVLEVIVGWPITLDNRRGPAAEHALNYAKSLAEVVVVPIRLVDERLTTAAAQRGLHEVGRTVKNSRSVIDQAAAVQLLQDALDTEARTGAAPGTSLEEVASE